MRKGQSEIHKSTLVMKLKSNIYISGLCTPMNMICFWVAAAQVVARCLQSWAQYSWEQPELADNPGLLIDVDHWSQDRKCQSPRETSHCSRVVVTHNPDIINNTFYLKKCCCSQSNHHQQRVSAWFVFSPQHWWKCKNIFENIENYF